MLNPNIIFETENYLIAEKPAGLLAYPLPGSSEKTIGDILGAIPVHRLDRDTSGLLILAKSNPIKETLQELFKERKIEKKYKALVWGIVESKSGIIDMPLGRGAKDRLRVVPKSGGRESITEYKVEKYLDKYTLLDVNLKTGRTHQIRVHFSAIGHPVVGDPKYSKNKTALKRQFLHAYYLNFIDPFSKEVISIESKLPQELEKFLKSIK